ncbi:hypothetical protein TIFTF001_029912 [Ficus carica]|uniref:Uncharacterized protein n=1 Tax=Ficus carica TaxID=3494 RepID=A0AA88DSG3_FICCA|nr:hypothetical protein TIFTF001_029912 [Ficus carica]
MADREMVDQTCDRPMYSVDYFTSAITPSYLAALREEFEIPNDVTTPVIPSFLEADAYKTQRGPYATQRQRVSHPNKLLRSLGQELCHGAAIQSLPKLV